jgi:uncharacterized membrane protein
MMFPSIPEWDGIHPVMVQFPIVLLLVAPLLLIVSLFARNTWRTWAGSALLLMVLGTLAAWLAVGSGHAAAQLVDKTSDLEGAIARHEAFGVMTRNWFTVLTAAFALLMALPAMMKKSLPNAPRIAAYALFAVVYLACTTSLANTAYRGGRLVHEMGVRAMVDPVGQRAALVTEQEAKASGARQAKPTRAPARTPAVSPATGNKAP